MASVSMLVVAVSLLKVKMVDVPVHLATGRLIVEQGVFPTTNTFSWTFPDYALYQQYPLFQGILYVTWRLVGFGGLSLVTCALWTTVLAVWIRWAGSWSSAARMAPAWLVGVLGVQRHLLLRPEVLSLLFLALMLVSLDRLRRDERWRWVGMAIFLQWMWANSHPLFAIGLMVQLAFVIHVALSRRVSARLGFSDEDRDQSMLQPLALFAGGVLASLITPLGVRSLLIPYQSILTVLTQGATTGAAQSAELAPVWTDPIATVVVIVALGVVLYAGIRSYGRWLWFEAALLVLAVVLVVAALRGIGFFSVLTMGVAVRWLIRAEPRAVPFRLLSAAASVITVIACTFLIATTFNSPDSFLRNQYGIGRAVGEWPDATIDYLDEHQPEGRMLNIGWAAANVLIWEGFEVFVDPRWETYPKSFLLESVEAMQDPDVLAGQIQEWQPSWIVAELRLPDVQERMAELVNGGEWKVVHADVLHLVLVPGAQDTEVDAVGWHSEYPIIYAQEKIRVACWYEHRGRFDDAQKLRAEAEERGGVAVAADLKRFGDCTGPDGKQP
ncbi:MAG: hypothetical protein P1T08_04785 [Acidimicrobiia bacterium]|nr:hypothetical protein [Acidimicrobiia bacterium]